MDNQKQENQHSSEMDLGQLFSRFGDALVSFGHWTMRSIAEIRKVTLKYKALFIVLIVISIGIGVAYSKYYKKKFFESSMILSSEYMNKRIVENSLKKLNILAGEESKSGLAKALGISDSVAQNIVYFEGKTFVEEKEVVELQVLKEQLKNSKLELENPKVIDDVIKRLEVENRHAFEFTVRLYRPEDFKLLEKGLVHYFKSNEYILKRLKINKSNLIGLRAKLQGDANKLDSLKSVMYDNFKNMAQPDRRGSNNVILDQPITNPIDIYSMGLRIYEELQETDKKIFLESDFEIVTGFTEMNVPASATTSQIAITSMLIGVLISYIIIALISFNIYLNKFDQDYK
jgi:hypothetical protein